jgi:hypothetical protein
MTTITDQSQLERRVAEHPLRAAEPLRGRRLDDAWREITGESFVLANPVGGVRGGE